MLDFTKGSVVTVSTRTDRIMLRIPRLVFFVLFSWCLTFGTASAQLRTPTFNYTTRIGYTNFIPLINICLEQNIQTQWDGVANKALLAKGGRYVTFIANEPLVNIDGVIRPLRYAPTIRHGTFLIPEAWPRASWWPWPTAPARREPVRALVPTLPPVPGGESFALQRIMIDAGHGGHDTGAKGLYGVLEKNLVLDLSLQLAARLRRAGFDVDLTRTTDTFIELDRRAEMVSERGADLFLSIHANSSSNHKARGFEVYYLMEAIDDQARALAAYENSVAEKKMWSFRRNSAMDPTVWDIILSEQRRESIMLARRMSTGLSRSALTINRGVKGAEFRVLTNTRVPALLVEVGFITNPSEARNLIDPTYRRRLISMLTQAVLDYREEYEATRGFTV